MRSGPGSRRPISVLVSTADRAEQLRGTLESLCQQSLPDDQFEVVVVDDGSNDGTAGVLESFRGRLPLRASYQRRAGLASALNHALYLAESEVVLFLSDELLAEPALLQQHLEAHRRFPDPAVAIAGEVVLSPDLEADPLMRLVWGEAERSWPRGKRSGWRLGPNGLGVAWMGRTSCRRDFLIEHGVFHPGFPEALAEVELAVRLARRGFALRFEPSARAIVSVGVTFEAWCRRCQAEGAASRLLSRLHPSEEVQAWVGARDGAARWAAMAPRFEEIIQAGRDLDRLSRRRLEAGLALETQALQWLQEAYRSAFLASRLKGLVEAGPAQEP